MRIHVPHLVDLLGLATAADGYRDAQPFSPFPVCITARILGVAWVWQRTPCMPCSVTQCKSLSAVSASAGARMHAVIMREAYCFALSHLHILGRTCRLAAKLAHAIPALSISMSRYSILLLISVDHPRHDSWVDVCSGRCWPSACGYQESLTWLPVKCHSIKDWT